MSSFDALGLEPSLIAALTAQGIETPFPVQEITLPDALAGRDVCAKAPTGSGKTLAYGLAVLQRVPKAHSRAPKALILVPTRELAKQVADVLAPYGRDRRRWVTAFFGGAGMPRQIADLAQGVDIAVATPGRLTDLVNRGECDLGDVEMVVIDEADRMADMGFTPQVTWLLERCAEKRQTLLFSATLDGDVDHLVTTYMHDPAFFAVDGPDGEEDDDAVLKRAKHLTIPTQHNSKFQDLAYVTDAAGRAIVFVKNRFATERVADALDDLGVRAVAMHGGMTQNARERALERWADGAVKALVATDVAARGVHVHGVELVVHLDPPQDEKDYIHRSGRTARAGADGIVVSLLRREQQRSSEAMFRRLGVEVTATTADDVRALVGAVRAAAPPAPPRPERRPARTASRPATGTRPERFDRTGSTPRFDRTGSTPRFDRSGSSERGRFDRGPAGAPRPDRDGSFAIRDARTDRTDRSARPERADRPDRAGRPSRPERAAWSPGPDRAAGHARHEVDAAAGGTGRPSRPWGADRPARPSGPWTPRAGDPRSSGPGHRSSGPGHHASGPGHRAERPVREARTGRDERPARAGGWSDDRPRRHGDAPRGPQEREGATRPPRPSAKAGGAPRPRGVPRFDDAAQPLNRRARRLLAFGPTPTE